MDVPEEYGGPGLSILAKTIVEEELSRSIALPARGMGGIAGPAVRAILYSLTGEMKEKYSAAGFARRENALLRSDRT